VEAREGLQTSSVVFCFANRTVCKLSYRRDLTSFGTFQMSSQPARSRQVKSWYFWILFSS